MCAASCSFHTVQLFNATWFSAAAQPQQSPRGPEGATRCRRVEIRQLHSSEAGEALIRLLQVQVDFYIFFFGIHQHLQVYSMIS